MLFKLTKSSGLTNQQLTQIRQLEQICNAHGALVMKLNWATLQQRPPDTINDFLCFEDSSLIGYLALYAFKRQEAEVSAMVHPNYRRQGIFKQLMAAAQEELKTRGIADFLFICEQASASGTGCMQAIGADYNFSEYKMELKGEVTANPHADVHLRPAQQTDLEKMVHMDQLCFDISADATLAHIQQMLIDSAHHCWIATIRGQIIGKIQATITQSEAYISGFCLFPYYRGRGYGTAILIHTINWLKDNGYTNIVLEVETENRSALSLYQRCGFVTATAYDYYRLPVTYRPLPGIQIFG